VAIISTLDDLLERYPMPSERVRTKKRPEIDPAIADVIARSPLVLLATSDATGRCDVSPRGGPPGFVHVVDASHVAIPDLNGNHLLDSLRNIIENPHAALLVVVPGQQETVRISGTATLVTDDDLLDRFTAELRRPTLAVVIEVAEVYTHCAKAFRRGRLWDPSSWVAADEPVVLAARHRQLDTELTLAEYVAENDRTVELDLEADRPL
jgi:PPOX class probable FMN-dependent enzyme